jgi:L-aspartate oxidase
VVFGARAAADIVASPLPELNARLASDRDEPAVHDRDFAVVEELRDLMSANVGVIRDGSGLSGAIRAIRRLSSRTNDIEISNMLTTALMIASSAWMRRESRGAQFRSDFPQADPAFARRSRMTLAEALKLADEVGV